MENIVNNINTEVTSTNPERLHTVLIVSFETTKKRYYFEVPVNELSGHANKIEIKVEAKSRLVKINWNSSQTTFDYSAAGVSTYTIQKRGLFDLD